MAARRVSPPFFVVSSTGRVGRRRFAAGVWSRSSRFVASLARAYLEDDLQEIGDGSEPPPLLQARDLVRGRSRGVAELEDVLRHPGGYRGRGAGDDAGVDVDRDVRGGVPRGEVAETRARHHRAAAGAAPGNDADRGGAASRGQRGRRGPADRGPATVRGASGADGDARASRGDLHRARRVRSARAETSSARGGGGGGGREPGRARREVCARARGRRATTTISGRRTTTRLGTDRAQARSLEFSPYQDSRPWCDTKVVS